MTDLYLTEAKTVKPTTRILLVFSRVFTGLIFTFSGFVKIVDPLGTRYKFGDYFIDGFGLDSLDVLSFPLAILMCAAEFIIGIALLINVHTKLMSWLALLFMLLFTPLTLWLAIADPIKDCGCFGDALILSNWQTFWKNVFILAVAVILFVLRKKNDSRMTPMLQHILLTLVVVFSFAFEWYNLAHLPVVDFRAYHEGANFRKGIGLEVPGDAPKPKTETVWVYKNLKTGEEKEFVDGEQPWQDSLSWEYVSYDSKVVFEGYIPPMKGFNMQNAQGEDVTEQFAKDSSYSLLLVTYDVKLADEEGLQKAKDLATLFNEKGYSFYAVTASLDSEIEAIKKELDINYAFYKADPILLKTVVRANPGIVLVHNGIIKAKWHHNDFPTAEKLAADYLSD